MGNLSFTLGDWVVLGFCAVGMVVVMALLLHMRRQELSQRAKLRASRAAVAEQMAPIATGESGQMPVYEHVIGDLFATADAVQYQELTGHVDQLAADIEARALQGKVKYGVHLFPHNGRSFVIDAYQEALDLIQYVKGIELEALEAGDERQAMLCRQLRVYALNTLLTLLAMQKHGAGIKTAA